MRTPNYSKLPEHMQLGMRRYVEDGIEPGSFLRLMLEHKIYEAAGYADIHNQNRLFDYIVFMYNDLPMLAHGSPELVDAWIAAKTIEREAKNNG